MVCSNAAFMKMSQNIQLCGKAKSLAIQHF